MVAITDTVVEEPRRRFSLWQAVRRNPTITFGAMLLIYGIPWSVVFGLAGLGAAGVATAYTLMPHVASRIDRFLNPDKGDTFQIGRAHV